MRTRISSRSCTRLQERAEFFGLDKTENFEEFKQKYLNAAESIENSGKDDIIEFVKADNIEQAKEFARDVLGISQTTAYSLGMNVDVANGLNEAVFKISNKFGSLTEYGYLENVLLYTNKDGAYAAYVEPMRSVFLNPSVKRKNAYSAMGKAAKLHFDFGVWSTPDAMHSVYHELGHAVQHMLLDNDPLKRKAIDAFYSETYNRILGDGFTWTREISVSKEMGIKAKVESFSYYGLKNPNEMIAESIAQYYLSKEPSDIAKSVIAILIGG